jgi:hypothetical protein
MMERISMRYSDKLYYSTVLMTAKDSSPSMAVLMKRGILSQFTLTHHKQQ